MIYLIEVNIYTAVMLLVYMALLRNKPMYGFSRYYLLAAGLLPLLLPFIKLPQVVQSKVQAVPMLQFKLPEVTIGDKGSAGGIDVVLMTWVVYGLVSVALIVYHVWNLYRLQRVVRSNEQEQKDGYVLIANSGYGPGSFGRYIFFPGDEVNEAILAHEKAHINLGHTRDILFLNLLQAVAWPSLLLGRVKKELKEVHEFQADAVANEDKRMYAELLISSVLNTRSLPEMHLFIIHPLKRRIMMLQKNGKGSALMMTMVVSCSVLVLLLSVLFVQGCNKTEGKKEAVVETGGVYTFGDTELRNDDSAVYSMVEKMPEPTVNLPTYLAKNITYPKEAMEQKMEGRVTVKFIVDSEGNIKDVKAMRSPNELLSKEAIRVVSAMPKWTPGEQGGKKVAVYFTLPIMFKLG